jgi:hypothetical protein
MLSKKKLLLASALLVLPLASYANLDVSNYTHEYSAVKVDSTQTCSGDLGHSTPPANADGTPGKSSTTPMAVRILCTGSKGNKCSATMYASENCSAGTEIGRMFVMTNTMAVTVEKMTNPHYVAVAQGSAVTLRYAG